MASLKNLLLICCFLIGTKIPAQAYYYDIQARVGAYYATSKQSREAFQNATPVYQLEASCFFSAPWEWVPWKVWTNGSYITGSGRSNRLGRTQSNMSSWSLGLKHSWRIDCYGEFYLGFGPSLNWFRMKTDGPLPEGFIDGRWIGHRVISKKNFGVVLKSGFQIRFWDNILVDVFADYQVLDFHYRNFARSYLLPSGGVFVETRRNGHHRLDLGGFVVGGAIGVPF